MDKQKIKTIGIIIVVVLVAIVVFQNTESTTLKFLAWEITAPRVVLYPALLGIGFVGGMFTHIFMQRRKRKAKKAGARADKAVKEMEDLKK